MRQPSELIAIGIDVGGTQARVAAIDQTARVLARRSRRMDQGDTVDQLVVWLVGAVANVRAEAGIDCDVEVPLGVALAGTLDCDRRAVVRSINLPFLEGYPLADALAHRVGRLPVLFTDAEAATWGEYVSRTPRPERFVHLRLGTGVACGAVIDGRLRRLDAGRRQHLELLVVEAGPNARMCRCGRRGCLETIASGVALGKSASQLGYPDDPTGVQQAWECGDKAARRLIKHITDALTTAVRNLTAHFDACIVCIGGGVVTQVPSLLEQTERRLHTLQMETDVPTISVESARLGDDAGLIGAAMLAITRT